MRKNIILCGVGGQGIVLTSKLLAASAMAKGIPVMSAETIGMAQKGGSVFSFLRMGDDLCCPMFPKGTADLLIGFEPAEAVRMLPYLKPDGTVILNTHPIQPVTATLGGGASTYAPIITTIVDRGYVEKEQKKLKTTPLGRAVNQVMLEQFPDIVDPTFSADMEKKLDVVEAGKADWVKTVDDFYQGFEKSLEAAEKNMEGKKIKVEDIPTDEICEKCGRPMVIKSGRYGKFVACSGFPECRNAHPIVKDTGGLCPLCGGHMLLRKSAKGRVYYGCSNYPTCNFMTWDEPVPETCPHCGKTLFKRRGQLYCAKEGCGFVKNIEKTNAEK